MTQIELLPCPFCGAELEKKTHRESVAWFHPGDVFENECPLSGWGFDRHQLVGGWNTRSPAAISATRDAEIEAYQEQIRQLQAVNQRWAATAGDDETEIEALGENNEPA